MQCNLLWTCYVWVKPWLSKNTFRMLIGCHHHIPSNPFLFYCVRRGLMQNTYNAYWMPSPPPPPPPRQWNKNKKKRKTRQPQWSSTIATKMSYPCVGHGSSVIKARDMRCLLNGLRGIVVEATKKTASKKVWTCWRCASIRCAVIGVLLCRLFEVHNEKSHIPAKCQSHDRTRGRELSR